MNYKLNGVFCIIVFFIALSKADLVPLPDYIQTCHKSDPDFTKCFLEAVETLRPKIASGMPELDLPPFEPLDLGDLIISKKEETGIDITVRHLNVYNATKFKVANFQNKNYVERLNFELTLPVFSIDGTYKLDGRILALPLQGEGHVAGDFENIKVKVKMIIETVKRDDKEYFRFKQINIKAKMGTGKIHFDNLFNGNKELGEAINESINENIVAMANEILPSAERALENKFLEIGNQIFKTYTTEQLLPN
ncbi:protein takeout-like [Condylostylus longicornis]|uniref:protein takeout-like n=1 Tax=Condylostylus longicornis TaxID=2530218 RepID=UPI00244D9C50|nr:protein takeout-like [Condylostylus longicornis]